MVNLPGSESCHGSGPGSLGLRLDVCVWSATAVFQRGSYYAVTCLSTFLPSKIDFDLTKSRILVYSDMQRSGGKDPP